MRLFVAIDIPEPAKQVLIHAQRALGVQGLGHFTNPQNLHLTLAFIGETLRESDAVQAMRQIQAFSFHLEFSSLGAFNDLYWVGIKHSPKLLELQQAVSHTLMSYGFSLEDRAYQPHITICRKFRSYGTVDASAIDAHLGTAICSIQEFSLMESTHCGGALVYRQRFSQKLL